MTGNSLPKSWRLVKFGDLVRKVNNRVDPESSGISRYVAGEHMDSDNLNITRWGMVGDGYLGPAFTMRFQPGQVLYGSRRTYLRKVALADFEGICANTTFVLETKSDDLLQEFLPHVMSTERFHAHSILKSKGSVNPYINFVDLNDYEFALPPIAEQHRIVSLMGESAKAISSYQSVMPILETLKASLWTEMVSRPDRDSQNCSLGSLISLKYGKALKESHRLEGDVPVYGSAGLVGYHDKHLTNADHNIVVGRKGSAGSITVVDSPCWVIDTAYFVVVKDEDLEFDFVKEMLIQSRLSELNTQTAVPGLNREEVYRKKVVLPNSAVRSEYLAKFEKLNSLRATLENHLAEARSVQASLRETLFLASRNV